MIDGVARADEDRARVAHAAIEPAHAGGAVEIHRAVAGGLDHHDAARRRVRDRVEPRRVPLERPERAPARPRLLLDQDHVARRELRCREVQRARRVVAVLDGARRRHEQRRGRHEAAYAVAVVERAEDADHRRAVVALVARERIGERVVAEDGGLVEREVLVVEHPLVLDVHDADACAGRAGDARREGRADPVRRRGAVALARREVGRHGRQIARRRQRQRDGQRELDEGQGVQRVAQRGGVHARRNLELEVEVEVGERALAATLAVLALGVELARSARTAGGSRAAAARPRAARARRSADRSVLPSANLSTTRARRRAARGACAPASRAGVRARSDRASPAPPRAERSKRAPQTPRSGVRSFVGAGPRAPSYL